MSGTNYDGSYQVLITTVMPGVCVTTTVVGFATASYADAAVRKINENQSRAGVLCYFSRIAERLS